MKIYKHCVPNIEDRCDSCRGRHISTKKKRVCPLYSLLEKKNPVQLYEYFAEVTDELRKTIGELEDKIKFILRRPRTGRYRYRQI
jgi:tRNA(Ser,Leu) C12 N-acetylase TAN1